MSMGMGMAGMMGLGAGMFPGGQSIPTANIMEAAHNPANPAVGLSGMGKLGQGVGGVLDFLKKNPMYITTDKFAISTGQPQDKSGFGTDEMTVWMEQLKEMMNSAKDGSSPSGGGYVMGDAKKTSEGSYSGGPGMFGKGTPPLNPVTIPARRVVQPPGAFGDLFGLGSSAAQDTGFPVLPNPQSIGLPQSGAPNAFAQELYAR